MTTPVAPRGGEGPLPSATESLAGRTAVVTGASQGIGEAVAVALAAEGMAVYACARRAAELERVAARAVPGAVLPAPVDLTSEAQVEALFARVAAERGAADLLVNCAGIFRARPLAETTLDEWRQVLEANLTAVFLTCREAMRQMVPRRRGAIVNFSSVGGRIGLAGKAAYCASKFGVTGLSKALAREAAPHRVKVHVIYPYVVDSLGREDWSGRPERTDQLVAGDAARAVLYLASLPARVAVPDLELNPLRAADDPPAAG